MGYLLAEAGLRWQGGAPLSREYGDIYWQAGQALAEKTHVFLAPLQRRLATAAPVRQGLQLVVGELGFGFGVNCLLTAAWWRRHMPADALLHYVAIEGHPLPLADLRRFHARAGLALSQALLDAWPGAAAGQHPLWLAGNVRLLLVHREATQGLGQLDAAADAWFLDGFSPACNPAMWSERLFRLLFARSRPGALIASYSVAGEVQRRLSATGFLPAKLPGYGRKKAMLGGQRRGDWRPSYRQRPRTLVLGAGLAGHFCAEALRRRGLPAPMVGRTSGNASNVPQLAVFPQLAARAEERHRFSLAASLYMLDAAGMRRTGVSRLARTAAEAARFRTIAAQFPERMMEWRDGRLHFHQAGWWSLADFAFDDARRLDLWEGLASGIARKGGGWLCQLQDGETLPADALLLATGHDARLAGQPLGLQAVPGLALTVPGLDLTAVATGPVSLFPPRAGRSTISGTYSTSGKASEAGSLSGFASAEGSLSGSASADGSLSSEAVADGSLSGFASADGSRALLKAAGKAMPGQDFSACQPEAHFGVRAVARDRLPVVGALPGQPGLHLCNGFGSHGATHARLCAEHLVSRMLGEPSPLSLAQQRLLEPARFARRDGRLSPRSAP